MKMYLAEELRKITEDSLEHVVGDFTRNVLKGMATAARQGKSKFSIRIDDDIAEHDNFNHFSQELECFGYSVRVHNYITKEKLFLTIKW